MQAATVSAQTAKRDHDQQHITMQTQTQALEQQLEDLRAEQQKLLEKAALEAQSASLAVSAKPLSISRPSVFSGVKAVLQRLNGSQSVQPPLPVSVPSVILGQSADTPTYLKSRSPSEKGPFQQLYDGHIPQPDQVPPSPPFKIQRSQEASVKQPEGSEPDALFAEAAALAGQQEDDWADLLR